MSVSTPALSVRDLRVEFPAQERGKTVKAVDGVSFDVFSGETFGLIGESGSGKTTIGRAVVHLVEPTSGSILHDGIDAAGLSRKDFRQARRAWQIVFQDPNAALDPRATILASVLEPLEIAGEGSREDRLRIAHEALARVGLPAEIAPRYPHQLSGGQKQRVVIARTLTMKPRFIVCDEVVAALDMSIRGDVLNLFAELQRELGLTYLFITHDLAVVSHISDRIAVAYLGRLVELGPAEAIAEDALHPYTRALMSSEPLALPSRLRSARRIVLEGEIPSPVDPPSGCHFRTRCPYATDLCARNVPQWREISSGRWVACHFVESENGRPVFNPPGDARTGGSHAEREDA